MEPIEVKDLTKDYGPNRAVERLTFDARKGEILGFLGPNGAGKTTTIRILSGYMPPTSGSVHVGGYDIIDQSLEARRVIGYLPETVPLYDDMTSLDYLTFMGELHGIKEAEDRAEDMLERVSLLDRADSYIGALSKGMRQRLGIAQALMHDPQVLLLDEPTIGLDPSQTVELRNLIKELGKEHTILLSTHILSEAQQVCNRVLIINKGHIIAEDSPEQLQQRLMGGERVLLHVREDAAGLIPQLKALAGVNDVQAGEDDELIIDLLPGHELRPDIARIAVQAGYDLLDLTTVRMTLEEIFLQLTQEENQTADVPAETEGSHA
jgi:ABC-2 type transport system ATP-binding protein